MHEHLDAFGIINMNGRVYDPLTAMFFSPDPFVQAPGNWLNYNRYSYVLNNPFKYTDPSGNLFYLIPTASYSYYGGLSVGISAGYGFPGGASVGGSVSYNFKQQNWTFTANASFGGLYAYAGYDTKAGVVAGAGFGFQSIVAGNFSFPTNLFGASINYSGKGGMSLSMFGFNMGSDGIIFDPSITASYSNNEPSVLAQEVKSEDALHPAKDDVKAKNHKLFYDMDMAYEYMWSNSLNEDGSAKVEIAAWILRDKKVLVLRYDENEVNKSLIHKKGRYDLNRKSMTVKINNVKYHVETSVHTHPTDLNSITGSIGVSKADIRHIREINRPIYILYNECIYFVHLNNYHKPTNIGTWKR